MFIIEYAKGVAEDLREIVPYERKRILDSIEEQLIHVPTVPSRNRKILVGLNPSWEYVEPVWELRVGEYRVFYDVEEEASIVMVRAIRHKAPHRTTKEII